MNPRLLERLSKGLRKGAQAVRKIADVIEDFGAEVGVHAEDYGTGDGAEQPQTAAATADEIDIKDE